MLRSDAITKACPVHMRSTSSAASQRQLSGRTGATRTGRFVANINAALSQQALDIAKWQRRADMLRHRQADNLRGRPGVWEYVRVLLPGGYSAAMPVSS